MSTKTDGTESDSSAATPTKKGKAMKSVAGKKAPSHPPVATMISDAIRKLNDKGGSSLLAIKKVIAETHKVDIEKLAPHLKKALKKGLETGVLTQARGKGASGSFKLSDKAQVAKKPAPENSSAKEAKSAPKKATGESKKPAGDKAKVGKAAKDTKSKAAKASPGRQSAAQVKFTAVKKAPGKKATPKAKSPKVKHPKTMKAKTSLKQKSVPKRVAPKKL